MIRRALRDWWVGLLWAAPAIGLVLAYAFADGWLAQLAVALLAVYVVALIVVGGRQSLCDWSEVDED